MLSASSKQSPSQSPEVIRPWGITAALLIAVVGFIFCQLLAQILVTVLPTAVGWTTAQVEQWLETPSATFIYVLLAEGFTIGLLAWFIRVRKANFWQAVSLRKPGVWDLPLSVAGFLGYAVIYALALLLLNAVWPIDTTQEQAVGFAYDVRGAGLIMAFISLVILPPVVEEIIFRGFLYGTLRRRNVSFLWSTIIVSVLFGFMHLFGGSGESVVIWIAFVDTLILSLALCYLREKTGNIWASIGLHAIKNCLVFVNLFIITSR